MVVEVLVVQVHHAVVHAILRVMAHLHLRGALVVHLAVLPAALDLAVAVVQVHVGVDARQVVRDPAEVDVPAHVVADAHQDVLARVEVDVLLIAQVTARTVVEDVEVHVLEIVRRHVPVVQVLVAVLVELGVTQAVNHRAKDIVSEAVNNIALS